MRVLVVDDNADQANSLSVLLKHSGYDSHAHAEARTCLGVVERLKPDVVLLDLGMPGMTGYEIAEKIKSQADLRQIRLIAVTGHGMTLDRLQSEMHGIDLHLVKPVDFAELDRILKLIQSESDE